MRAQEQKFFASFFQKRSSSLLLSFTLGAFTALALPPFNVVPVAFVGIPGLLALIGQAPTFRAAAGRGFIWGIGFHLIGLYWVTNAILVEAADFWWAVPIAVPLLAAVLGVFIAVPSGLARLAPPGWPRVAVLAGLWELADIARQFALSGFPWNPLGSIWEMPGTLGLVFMQPAAWVGVGGLTLSTVLITGVAGLGWRGVLAAAAGLTLWAAAGSARLHEAPGPAPGLAAVMVQGNVSELEHRDHWQDRAWMEQVFNRYLALTRQGVREAGDRRALVVWPETASPYWLGEDPPARAAIAAAAAPAIATIAGTIRADRTPVTAASPIHNSLVVILPDGSVGGFYDKHHLVPYGEYFPSYMPIRLGEQGFAPGHGPRTLHVPGLPPCGPLICFEAVFPAAVVDEHDRPAFMINLTNDSWFGNSSGPRQHLAAARLRAVEEGMPLVRAANTGISALIDSHGMVVANLGLDRQGVLVVNIPGYLARTFFSRLGLWIPAMFSILSCMAGSAVAIKRGASDFMDNDSPKNAKYRPKS